MTAGKITALVVSGVLVLIALGIVLTTFVTVNPGEKAIVLRLGAIDRTLAQGFHLLTPFAESAVILDTRVQKEQADATAASKDLQTVAATVAVNYNIDGDKISELYTNVGTDYKTKVIDPAIQEVVKAVTAKYTMNDLLAQRAQVSSEMREGLIERLQPYYIHVTDVSIVNFSFSASVEAAIEGKVAAEQSALAAKNKLDQAQYDAQAIRVKSEAANNEKYIELQRLEVEKAAIEKWDGKLPQQFIPGSALPFINLAK